MAYMSQENKKALAVGIKAVLKKHGMKGTLRVRHHSTLVCTITKGLIDFEDGITYVNEYWIEDHFKGKQKEFLLDLKSAMMVGNHNNSDIMTDYFDVGWYVDIKIGTTLKPYTKV